MPRLFAILCITSFLSLLAACGGGGGGGGGGSTGGNAGGGAAATGWSIPEDDIRDGGPGKDGIPALVNPEMISPDQAIVDPNELVVGIKRGSDVRAYPHDILDWHEIVNDLYDDDQYVLSYCPLTGSSVLWNSTSRQSARTFGVSGLLYNSNLILYDRDTDSHWSQMLEEAVEGTRRGEIPEKLQLVETTWATWRQMYPDTRVLSRNTGHDRDYDDYPYGSFRTDGNLIWSVNPEDMRLHPKERVIGIRGGSDSRAYQISGFGNGVTVINDMYNGQEIVVIGSTEHNLGVIYGRLRGDGSTGVYTAIQNDLPNVMRDDEGNVYDIFGEAVSGPRTGETLPKTESFTAYWFAWAAFYPTPEIYF